MVSVSISNVLVVVLGFIGASEAIFFGNKGGNRQRRPHYKKCVPYVEYVTTYETEYVQQPVYKTAYETEYVTQPYYETIYKTDVSIVYSTEYVPQYVTQTEYKTEVNYHTKYQTSTAVEYQPVYITETKQVPSYVTTTDIQYKYQTQIDYQTVYSTIYQPQYITQTEYQTQYETQYETQYTPQYVTETISSYETQTYCPPEPQQGYSEPQVSYGGGLNNLNSYSPPAPTSFIETSNFQVLDSAPGLLEFHGIGALDGGSTYLQKRQVKVEEAFKALDGSSTNLQKRQTKLEEVPIAEAKEEKTEVNAEDKSETVDAAR